MTTSSQSETQHKRTNSKVKCGTNSGYATHRYYKEEACEPCKEARRLASEKWRKANRDKANSYNRAWALQNLEHVRAKNRRYNHENRDKREAAKRRRRALERGNDHTPYSTKQVLEIYGSHCHLCTELIDLTAPRNGSFKGYERGLQVDHVIPLARGGSDNIENVRPSHAICNMRKGARYGEEVA